MKSISFVKTSLFSALFALSAAVYADAPADVNITQNVKNNISNNTKLSEFNIDVITNDGVVELVGMVNADADAETIIEIAQSTEGVKDVETSQLKVKDSQQPFADTVITAKVKGEFIKAKLFGEKVAPMSIHVETKDGIVYLSGNARTQTQIDNAIDLAKKVKNVKEVQSKVALENGQQQ
jgi:osmotically-inducible protein OsmY